MDDQEDGDTEIIERDKEITLLRACLAEQERRLTLGAMRYRVLESKNFKLERCNEELLKENRLWAAKCHELEADQQARAILPNARAVVPYTHQLKPLLDGAGSRQILRLDQHCNNVTFDPDLIYQPAVCEHPYGFVHHWQPLTSDERPLRGAAADRAYPTIIEAQKEPNDHHDIGMLWQLNCTTSDDIQSPTDMGHGY